ncbi:MAG: thioredoxin domain-containing protein [Calditrichaceae bacterium]
MHEYTNHLISETSPYLLQHAHNPVNWYPWGEEALRLAKEKDKPIFLSIGYAACHWCHVMEKESFEDEETAKIMNELFINIKVDREERPDIDQIYMTYVQMYTGSGGWPMSVFLTPDQKPFYGGTYFPPEDRYGRPGFKRLIKSVAEFYHHEKDKLDKSLQQVHEAFNHSMEEVQGDELPGPEVFDKAINGLKQHYEPDFGGIGHAPKFPAVQVLNLFMRKYNKDHDKEYLDMVTFTLKNMANGGIYDQIGGGFARYSVDERWLVPHFEKMLYDNAQLAPLYLDTYLLTGDDFYKNVAFNILEFVSRELYSDEGGFYSSLDADSEGEEGKFYVWTKDEILNLLENENGEIFCSYYGVTEKGNFEGTNILHVSGEIDALKKKYRKTGDEIKNIIADGKKILLNDRENRIRPGLDDKVLTSWNGLMLSAYARAYQIERNDKYRIMIEKNIDFMKKVLFKNGPLFRTYKTGTAKYSGYLDDYANLIKGLLDSYEALFDDNYLKWAFELTQYVNRNFLDPENGGYYYTSNEQEELFKRLKDDTDQSIPSGTGIMILNNLRIFSITDDNTLLKICEDIFKKYGEEFSVNPYGYASYLNALDFYIDKPKEILIARPQNAEINPYLDAVNESYIPNKVLMIITPGETRSMITNSLLRGKEAVNGEVSAYVCQNYTCSLPVFSPEELKNLIND